MTKLAVVTTHPIQYYAPLFRRLAERGEVAVHVYYGWRGAAGQAAPDKGFGTSFAWDVPLLDGYAHTFVENVSDDPGTHHAAGIDAPGMVAAIEAWGPDAVLVFGWNYRAHRAVMKAFRGHVPVLFRGDSTLIDERTDWAGRARTIARRLYLRWIYRDIDRAVTVGTHNEAYFRAHGVADDRLSWAPHAIDNDRFATPGPDPDGEARQWRRELGIGDDERAVVFVGKLEHKKAPDVLLRAFLGLPAGTGHLVFCGAGPLEDALRHEAAGRPDVHFLGFQNQSRMPIAYRLGDVVALPSRGPGETWGLAVNEAMASGRAVIVSDRVGCAPDLVDDSNGRVVPVGDADALREALAAVLAPGAAEAMGRQSRQRIDAWSIDAAAQGIEAAVHQALDPSMAQSS